MKNNYILTFFFIIISLSQTTGQKIQYVTYQGEQMPFQKVNQVIQDTKEYMWLATDQGLYRFDGTTFKDFNTSLKSRYIKSFISFEKDTILFSNDSGIFKLFYTNDKVNIIPYLMVSEENIDLTYPDNLFKDSTNRLWIAQPDGTVFLWNDQTLKGVKIALLSNEKTPRIFFGEDEYKTVWVLVPNKGLYYFNEKSNDFKLFKSFDNIQHFYIDKNNFFLVGKEFLKLTINENQKITKHHEFKTGGINFNFITKDRSENYFLTSDTKIYTFFENSKGASISKVYGSNDPHRVEELPFTSISHLYFSADQVRPGGTVWVSTANGLGQLFSNYFQSVSGMSLDNVSSICASGNNEILISQGNVTKIYHSNGKINFNKIDGLTRVIGMSSHNRDNWYGTADATIVHYRDGLFQNKHDLGKSGGGIFFMYADHKGDNWFCQAPKDFPIVGISKINSKGNIVIYDDKKGLISRILVVKEGGRSELYAAGIGTDGYLYKYNRTKDIFENKSLPFSFKISSNFEVHDIAVDDKGIVWLGTTDGLLKYDTENIQRIDLGNFTKNEIRSVAVMRNGSLWLATDTSGIINLNQEGNRVLFDEKSGTPSKVASYRSMVIDSNQHLWVGTAEGAVYSVQSNPAPLVSKIPILHQIQVNNKKQELKESLILTESVNASLQFASIAFPGGDVQYQHKLFKKTIPKDDVEDIPWSEPVENNEVKLKELKGGIYSLHMRAQKTGGYAWSSPVEIDIIVKKKWYKTWWGILILLISGGLFFWYYVRLWVLKKTKTLEASLNLKQKELNEKEAELRSQSKNLKHQSEELKSVSTNIYMLFRLLRQIPKGATWSTALPVLKKLVELPTGIDAFELAFKIGEEIRYLGYKRDNNQLLERNEEFNEKNHLASYILIVNKPLLINDFEKEAEKHITKKDNKGYLSRILIPFEQKKGTEAVFIVYGLDKDKFTQKDLTMIQILTIFLSVNIKDELK